MRRDSLTLVWFNPVSKAVSCSEHLSAPQLREELGFELKQFNPSDSSSTLLHLSIIHGCGLSLRLTIW